MARVVELVLPEEQWQAMGLHGLSERMLRKRLSALVSERMSRRNELDAAMNAARRLGAGQAGFAAEIQDALKGRKLLDSGAADSAAS
jgi:hypothetical protein